MQCRYDPDENECLLFLDSQQANSLIINTYSIVVPYVSTSTISSDSEAPEFSVENGEPRFHLPFFFGVLNSKSSSSYSSLRMLVDVFQLADRFPSLLNQLDTMTPV